MILTTETAVRSWLQGLPGIDQTAVQRLEQLGAMLVEENRRQNLVSANSLGDMWVRHIADSAQLLNHVPRETPGPWLDLGTGAGFPGLVISAMRPQLAVTMVETRARRVEWLSRVVDALSLSHAIVVPSRLELVPSAPFAVISARAFAPLDRLLDLSARFSTADTLWLLPKGRSARDEVERLSGWTHTFHVEQSVTDRGAGVVVGRVSGRASTSERRTAVGRP